MRTHKRVLLTGAALAATAIVGVTPAFADGTSAQLNGLQLVARGVAVNATISVTCDAYTDVWGQPQTSTPVNVTVSEAVHRGNITQSTGVDTVACDSTAHKIAILVQATTYAFTRGSALITITPTFNNATTPPTLVTTAKIK